MKCQLVLETSKNQLSSQDIWSEGSEVWVVADLSESRWTQIFDWYLNFQISKAKSHKRLETFPHGMQEVQKLCGDPQLEVPLNYPGLQAPLMISADGLLPTRSVVVLPGPRQGEGKSWQGDEESQGNNQGGSARDVSGVSSGELQQWFEKIYQISLSLGCQSIRTFLPDDISENNLDLKSLSQHLGGKFHYELISPSNGTAKS